ncbi:MAG: bifunctional folylpolyglutamate synthase/dihydrofolate synthase, partial [Thermoplasmata archaeon]|nr:bifunctional folylpolyglutamate synthase/dihydrofolate synthase [Thermoplasmata archaeon]
TDYGYATYFEVVTAMALKYFADNCIDFVVLEVGLGGKFDATNVVKPVVTVLTNIDLDHTEHLGNTITSVAENKAGIIKPGSPVITSNNNPEVLEVLTKTCEKQNKKIVCIDQDFQFNIKSCDTYGLTWDYHGMKTNYTDLQIPLLGQYQAENGALALGTLELLMETDSEHPMITENNIRTGLKNSIWPGRLEVLQRSPTVLLDGAHNPAGARALKNALDLFEYDNLHLVFGCSEEKDIKSIAHEILPLAQKIYITQADIRRAAEPDLILKQIKDYNLDKIVIKPVSAAVNTAIQQAQKHDLVCVCGSLFVVGEARELWTGNNIGENGNKLPRIHY